MADHRNTQQRQLRGESASRHAVLTQTDDKNLARRVDGARNLGDLRRRIDEPGFFLASDLLRQRSAASAVCGSLRDGGAARDSPLPFSRATASLTDTFRSG